MKGKARGRENQEEKQKIVHAKQMKREISYRMQNDKGYVVQAKGKLSAPALLNSHRSIHVKAACALEHAQLCRAKTSHS